MTEPTDPTPGPNDPAAPGTSPLKRYFPYIAGAAVVMVLAIIAAVAIAGGGDDDDEDAASTATEEGSASPEATESPTPSETPSVTETTTAAATTTATAATPSASATGEAGGELTIYSGRSKELVQPLIDRFADESGVEVKVEYGTTSELTERIAKDGEDSAADVFFADEAGSLGSLEELGLLEKLSSSLLDLVAPNFRSGSGGWAGITAHARVLVYNTDLVKEADLPASLLDLTGAAWKGKVGWAPEDASFQALVTAFRVAESDDEAGKWLEAMKANGVKDYDDNAKIVAAVGSGEIAIGLVDHFYVWTSIADEGEGFKARNHHTAAGDIGSLVNVSGAAILKSSENKEAATAFIAFLLSTESQQYFATETFEYPLVEGVDADSRLVPLAEIEPPDVDLSDLADVEGTLDLLRESGVLP